MKILYQPFGINNYHNRSPLILDISGQATSWHSVDLYVIDGVQAEVIYKHFCGVSQCDCLSGKVFHLSIEKKQFGIDIRCCRVVL